MEVTVTPWMLLGFVLNNYYHNGSVGFRSITSTIWHVYDDRVLFFLTPQLHVGSLSNSWHRCLSEFKEEALKTQLRAALSIQMQELY